MAGPDRPPIRNMTNIENILVSTLTEKPLLVEIEGKYVAFPPMSLGQSLLVAQVARELGFNSQITAMSPILEVVRVVEEKKPVVCRYLALRSFHAKNKLLNEREIEERTHLFENVDIEELATLLLVLLTDEDKAAAIIKHYGIDKEQANMGKAAKAKKDDNSLNFGGCSIYGQLIDRACERYGWTVEYVVWGISYANLTLMLADQQTSIYLTEEELKKAKVRKRNEEVINGDDPASQERLKAILKG